MSASSTWQLGERHHLGDLARVALILMLEVGSVTGASLYVSARETATRVCAGLLVGIATLVAATGGVQAYGFLVGLPVAAVLLLMVETIARYWRETAGTAQGETPAHVDEPGPVHVAAERAPLVGLPATGTEQTGTGQTGNGPVPVVGPARAGTAVKHSDDDVVTALRAQLADPEQKDPTVDAAVARFGMGKTRATRLVREAKSG